jgi:hypothetical protein
MALVLLTFFLIFFMSLILAQNLISAETLGSGGMRINNTVNGSIDEEELGDGIVRTLR